MAELSATDGGTMSSLPPAFLLDLTLEDVFCQMLKIDPAEWHATKALYASGTAWSECRIPKKKGFRIIHPPQDPLKKVSKAALMHVLQSIPVHMAVHGAHPGTSIVTNARVHAGFARAFYALDLKDAFPSTDKKRLIANLVPKMQRAIRESTGLDELETQTLAEVILELALVNDSVPQGFPTSSAVLNVVLYPVDREITQLLRSETARSSVVYRYTRFVDDLTISTNVHSISNQLRMAIRRVIRTNGWIIQKTKTKYFGTSESDDDERTTKMPEVTGIIPNPDGRLTIARSRLNRYRAIIHQLMQVADARESGQDAALCEATEQMHQHCARLEATGERVIPTSVDQFYGRTWPLTQSEFDLLVGLVGFVGMVYEGEVPSVIRKPYQVAKARFKIGQKHIKGARGYRVL